MIKLIRRHWWVLLVTAAVLGVVWRLMQPPEMQLVACIPATPEGIMGIDYEGHWCYFSVERAKRSSESDYLTLVDWDARPRWRIPLHLPTALPWDIDVSTDGHLVALLFQEQFGLHVQRWRDGLKLTEQIIP